jgi:hypothetical protein
MHTYQQSTGKWIGPEGACWGQGYAGRGAGKNNPTMQAEPLIGPLPCGDYTIGPVYDHPKLGPVTMNLTPDPHNEMFGRAYFRIHPDAIDHPGHASEGCIVQARSVRERIATSPDHQLRVVA